ncbi:alpha,alpha-trehalose-phosphate synthase (UDP-forming) [Arvimicrobium flavum]|uniref:alpha,alpha-trehalose-phosphate synthase (UDP-forming) n=1 Tax=Arvimicrobium flavum TaxID=3393320 RepID=UPI00237A910A|nr:trehalose-6-phosphate synthase [Mesorhizobium shangrilense]
MIDDVLIQWSPETLRAVLADDLEQAELMVVSNREPYAHEWVNDRVELQMPASGLVSALDPVMRAFAGTWIAYGGGSADREAVDSSDCLGVPPHDPHYRLRRVWLTKQQHDGHYSGLSNEGLWPLCHIAFARPTFRASDWDAYREVNRRFAAVVAEEAETANPVVLVQDYHFSLLPGMIRDLMPAATILTFWHIPWPNAEQFGVCPWHKQILDGLLGSSIVGFHTGLHCSNFLDCVDRFVECRIDRQAGTIHREGHTTSVNAYPISIPWPAQAEHLSRSTARELVGRRYDIPDRIKLIAGVERLDYTKGIIERLRAVETLLESRPEWIGRIVMAQVASPSRSNLPAYQRLRRECTELVDCINARYGRGAYRPVLWLERHHSRAAVDELLAAADICVVSSLHDGMNLVAKEFVAARHEDEGVLILSPFTGASQELVDALLVNPYDTVDMAEAMHRALTMPPEEQAERMRSMREVVRSNNVYRWAGRMLLDAVQARRRNGHASNGQAQNGTSVWGS